MGRFEIAMSNASFYNFVSVMSRLRDAGISTTSPFPAVRDARVDLIPIDAYRLDRRSSTAHVADALVKLTPREFAIAWLLFRHDGKYVSRRLIAGAVWNRSEHDVGRTLEQHIYRLRKKLALHGEHGVRLQTMYARGYRIEAVENDMPICVSRSTGCPRRSQLERYVPDIPAVRAA